MMHEEATPIVREVQALRPRSPLRKELGGGANKGRT